MQPWETISSAFTFVLNLRVMGMWSLHSVCSAKKKPVSVLVAWQCDDLNIHRPILKLSPAESAAGRPTSPSSCYVLYATLWALNVRTHVTHSMTGLCQAWEQDLMVSPLNKTRSCDCPAFCLAETVQLLNLCNPSPAKLWFGQLFSLRAEFIQCVQKCVLSFEESSKNATSKLHVDGKGRIFICVMSPPASHLFLLPTFYCWMCWRL